MKTIHIIIIIVVVIIVAVVITTFTASSTYSNFSEAGRYPGKELSIIGQLNRNKPIEYDVLRDPNKFSFFMTDEKGNERKVVYHQAKPHDFEKSDQLVLIGYMEHEVFVARSLLLKCPTKYNSKKTPEEFGTKKF